MNMQPGCPKVFLLSPADCNGKRARMLANPNAQFDLALRFRAGEAGVSEVFAFISGLYFRGKVAYTNRFATEDTTLVITPAAGLVTSGFIVTPEQLTLFAGVPIDLTEPAYLEPLTATVEQLHARIPAHCEVVLLGSIATPKYVQPLLSAFGSRLLFPEEFIGRGDMSRGGLMLRAAQSGEELTYIPVGSTVRRGKRPPRLPKPIKSR